MRLVGYCTVVVSINLSLNSSDIVLVVSMGSERVNVRLVGCCCMYQCVPQSQ